MSSFPVLNTSPPSTLSHHSRGSKSLTVQEEVELWGLHGTGGLCGLTASEAELVLLPLLPWLESDPTAQLSPLLLIRISQIELLSLILNGTNKTRLKQISGSTILEESRTRPARHASYCRHEWVYIYRSAVRNSAPPHVVEVIYFVGRLWTVDKSLFHYLSKKCMSFY